MTSGLREVDLGVQTIEVTTLSPEEMLDLRTESEWKDLIIAYVRNRYRENDQAAKDFKMAMKARVWL